ncbi:MAG: ABC transporter permease [Pseudomonadota bacterium]
MGGAVGAVVVLLLGAPVLLGLVGVVLPAFGYLPALGGESLTLDPWRQLFAEPGLWTAALLGLSSGLLATLLSLCLVIALLAAGPLWLRRGLQALLAPLVAVPHIALAVGLTFLIMPSGWLVRFVSPWPSGWERPPDLAFPQDDLGLSLILGLVAKETPFLLLMALAALPRLDEEWRLAMARSLGYHPVTAWLKTVLPDLLRALRLPLAAVLSYGVANVEMAVILGPNTPPTLAILILDWFRDPDLAQRFLGSAAALLQLGIVLFALALTWGLALGLGRLARRLAADGRRGQGRLLLPAGLWLALPPLLALTLLALLVLFVWSFAARWRFPDLLPVWSLETWQRQGESVALLTGQSLALALCSTAIALLLAFALLESRRPARQRAAEPWLLPVLALPLLVPQIAFLFGAAVAALQSGIAAPWFFVLWGHLLFVLPYVYLTLAGPHRGLDRRYHQQAISLGKGPWRVFFTVTLPLLRAPLLTAAAVGLAVSFALYLPTVLLGGGRVVTLASEAVALSGGGDRRLLAVTALLQALVPLLAIALAIRLGRKRRFLP